MTSGRRPGGPIDCVELVELVTDYLEGDLPADLRAAVDAHLAECPGCRTHLEQMRQTIDQLGRLPPAAVSLEGWHELLSVFRRLHRLDGHRRRGGGKPGAC